MLLNALKVTNSRGSVLNIPLEDYSSGFFVKNIDGLDPVKANLVSTSFANQNGEQYQSSRREVRDIKITLGLDPKYEIQDAKALRDQLYTYFMPQTESLLTFSMFDRYAASILNETLNLDIVGRVETFEAPLFTADPEVNVTLRCFDPDFYDPNLVSYIGVTNSTLVEQILTYKGTVETGVLLTITPTLPAHSISSFSIYHHPPDGSFRGLDFNYPLVNGDTLTINSKVGEKSVIYKSVLGAEKSVLYAVTPQSSWFELQPGDNQFQIYANIADPGIPFKVEYMDKYGGL